MEQKSKFLGRAVSPLYKQRPCCASAGLNGGSVGIRGVNRINMEWATTPRQPPGRFPRPKWKDYLREACPHGLHVVLVDGTHVRNTYDSDFCQGGNGFAYPDFVPKNEIWIDNCIPPAERALVAFHECVEAELMRDGASYDRAHREAKRLEDEWRKTR